MESGEIEAIEIDLLIETIYRRYGHDFRNYSRHYMERRIRQFLMHSEMAAVSDLIPKILHDEVFFSGLLAEFSTPVSEMFRNPFVYRSIREKVVPLLRTYPFIRCWVAGCANGEEVYSLAVLIREEGLEDRTTIFATDFNDSVLEKAREGIYPIESIRQFTENYQATGGPGSFSEYYHAGYGYATLDPSLRKKIVFANHNLATDGVFSELHLILCRNVLIYFGRELQDRVLDLFTESLVRGGFLCLGTNEEVLFSKAGKHFRRIDEKARIFQLAGI